MILEQAIFTITPGSEQEFEEAMQAATAVFEQATGFRSLTLRRSVERPSTYTGLIEWDTVEDHTVGFRESELFTRYRALVGPFFAAAPEVQHFEAPAVVR
jgi:heme-degrading monooxygenase HmoA